VYSSLANRIIPLQQPLYKFNVAILAGITWVERTFEEQGVENYCLFIFV